MISRNIEAPDCTLNNGSFELLPSGGSGSYTFYIDGVFVQSDLLFENMSPGSYEVLVIDEFGCEFVINVEIPCAECDIYIPNVIIPDVPGPDELFKIYAHPNFIANVKLYNIYDRWGGLVYTASDFPLQTDKDKWWDGYFNNVKVVPGVYTYMVIIEDSCEKQTLFVDDVTVLR